MKLTKNLPIYVLSIALIFVGIASASQAQAAWSSKETARVKALENKVQQLMNATNSNRVADLEATVQELESKLATYKTSANSVLIPEAYSDLLGSECGRAGRYEREFAIGGKRFFQCRFNFVIGG
jgi:BMFP domain-containing protein YqiC